MKSLTHDFDYIDNFVTFVLCWKDSSTSKSNYKINNLNRVLQEGRVIAYPLYAHTNDKFYFKAEFDSVFKDRLLWCL